MLYGKDWKKMVPLIRTRTLLQIRTHAQKMLKTVGHIECEGSGNQCNTNGKSTTCHDAGNGIIRSDMEAHEITWESGDPPLQANEGKL
jgi:hypothetical protein